MSNSNNISTRKSYAKTLSTDEKTLKSVYDNMAGYYKRSKVKAVIEQKRNELAKIAEDMPSAAKVLLHQMNSNSAAIASATVSYHSESESDVTSGSIDSRSELLRVEAELIVDQYFRLKEELRRLEEGDAPGQGGSSSGQERISFRDIDALTRDRGATLTRRQIEQMIWEVDERFDEEIDAEEFYLTYYRNINDTTGNEPNSFFRLMEFMIFDAANKGYIIEDDCMEILYGRYGGVNLEKELKLLFGKQWRAEGGDGTLTLSAFLQSFTDRNGRRALVT
eukprot:gene25095-33611_t